MKFPLKDRVPLFFALAGLFWCAHASAQTLVVLQDFSATVGDYTFFSRTWEATGVGAGSLDPNANFQQGAGVYDFSGSSGIVPTNDAGSLVEFFYGEPLDIADSLYLSVAARTLAGNESTSFIVTLFDGLGGSAFAAFATGDFSTGSYPEITVPLTFLNGFNPAHLDSMVLSGGQPFGTDAFAMSFDSISATSQAAVPEIGSYALLSGFLVLGAAFWRRRFASV